MTNTANSELYVLVVDDTVVYRRILQNVVSELPNAKVVGVAANGRIALERLDQLEVDVILLDVEMPEMDGLETLEVVRQRWPGIGVILLSGANKRAADLTMRALELGALDFVPKVDTGDASRNHSRLVGQLGSILRSFAIRRQLRYGLASVPPAGTGPTLGVQPSRVVPRGVETGDRVESASELLQDTQTKTLAARANRTRSSSSLASIQLAPKAPSVPFPSVRPASGEVEVLLVGCSTGGPQALAKIVPNLPLSLGLPVLIVQHMPPVFTASMAESLNRTSALRVLEATDGQLVQPNVVLIAPGGRHMIVRVDRVKNERRIAITDDPPVNSCRPSVDVLFRSAAEAYGGNTLSVVLTGMGEDGLEGVRALRAVGGRTLSQSEESCVVFGMPRAIEAAGFADEVVSLEQMANRIAAWLRFNAHRSHHAGEQT
jgi:two-component system chemotaxis response regulator CheB